VTLGKVFVDKVSRMERTPTETVTLGRAVVSRICCTRFVALCQDDGWRWLETEGGDKFIPREIVVRCTHRDDR